MPDMDIDFAVAGRDRVINYVAEKYGRDRVAQILTCSARFRAPLFRPSSERNRWSPSSEVASTA